MNFNPRSSCEERPCGRQNSSPPSHFNPRSSCEERHYRLVVGLSEEEISIHAPHARSDQTARIRSSDSAFQSTLLMRGATVIKALLIVALMLFQSTLLMRGATQDSCIPSVHLPYFNPRSSCEERRHARRRLSHRSLNFNPRSSCEERLTRVCTSSSRKRYFNPRSSCEERRHRQDSAFPQ